MLGFMNGTKTYHGYTKNHGLTLEYGLNQLQLSIIVNHLIMKVDIQSGLPIAGKKDGYCNGVNLPGAYIVGNTLCYQDLEWYDALKDSELKDEALRNKAIMEGLIDEDDESSNNGWRR
ncbi:hypothetical protein Tco_0813095 [Tanacetum coccineum]